MLRATHHSVMESQHSESPSTRQKALIWVLVVVATAVTATAALLNRPAETGRPAEAAAMMAVDASGPPVAARPTTTTVPPATSTSSNTMSTAPATPSTTPPTTTLAPTTQVPTTQVPTTQVPVNHEPPPVAEPQPVSNGDVWDALAQCESGGNWSINTGNGYYGGLQFSLSSWRGVGGTGFPHEASRETQIAMGERLRASGGWGHWPACSRKLGLR